MALEMLGFSGPYYYKKVRDGDIVRSVYQARGSLALLEYRFEEIHRAERMAADKAKRKVFESEMTKIADVDHLWIWLLDTLKRSLTRCSLFMAIINIRDLGGGSGMPGKTVAEKKAPSLSELIKRTDKENPRASDLAMIKGRLDEDDWFVEANAAANYTFNQVVESLSSSALVRELYARNRKKEAE